MNVNLPYKMLYIYYLKGRVPPSVQIGGDAFIGNWEEEQDTFLFFHRASDQQVQKVLEQNTHLVLADQFEMTYEQWQGGRLSPLQIGNIKVVPAWDAQSDHNDVASILLDPGVVFGAGTHPTTRDCLAAVQAAFTYRKVTDVIDLGTGTGLLALAAVRCGAQRCVAVDLNRLAAQTAIHNARLNKMMDRLMVVIGDAKNFIDLSCDLMISNIHYDVMQHIIAARGFQLMKQFVLSGMLRSQAREIENQLIRCGANILQKWKCDDIWYTYHGTCG